MAEHVWSVLCHRACIDKSTNLISLLEVTERVNVQADMAKADAAPEGTRLLAPAQMHLASWWKRSQSEEPEAITTRLTIFDVDGGEFSSNEIPVPLDEHESYRAITAISVVPIDRGPGTMHLVVSKQDGEDWIEVARLPLEIGFVGAPAQPGET